MYHGGRKNGAAAALVDAKDCWSGRVTQEHPLVYRVTGEAVDFLQSAIIIDPFGGNADEECCAALCSGTELDSIGRKLAG